jgi:tryptophan-rich sensory protein
MGDSLAPARIAAGDRRGLIAAIAASVAAAVVVNGSLAALRLNAPLPAHWPAFAPPGPAIGIIWVLLFAAMGAAAWYARPARRARAVTGLIVLCLVYPFYTHAIPGHVTELIGNIVTFVDAAWLIARLRRSAPVAAALIGLVALWIAFATALVVGLVELNGWST